MQTRLPPRHSSATIQKPRLFVGVPPSAVLPRRIAPGIFFVSPSRGIGGDSGNGDDDNNNNNNSDALPSAHPLAHPGITHAVVQRGADAEADYHFRFRWASKALFVGAH